jgi:hypothetical protein
MPWHLSTQSRRVMWKGGFSICSRESFQPDSIDSLHTPVCEQEIGTGPDKYSCVGRRTSNSELLHPWSGPIPQICTPCITQTILSFHFWKIHLLAGKHSMLVCTMTSLSTGTSLRSGSCQVLSSSICMCCWIPVDLSLQAVLG